MKHMFCCLLLVTFSPLILFGQRTTATISGAVTDPSGAVVPNARVTATNTSTGAANSVTASAGGFYVIPNLEPGPYRLDVAVTGFQSYAQTGIVLQVGAELSVNVSLKLGSATEKVTVTSQAPLVNTRDQTVSFAVTPQFTEQLPLNGRNILQLMALAPDTSEHGGPLNYSNQVATRPESAAGFVTASGEAREGTTTFFLNGGLNMDTYTEVSNAFPNPDAVEEFTYDTNSYNAKYSGMGGGIVNAVTRGGSNKFHGSAFEYLRNGVLNGRNFFAANQDTLKRNQFGFSLGAPIQKDKTFAFFSFQRTTLRYGTTANVAYGPTYAMLGKNPDGSAHYCPGSTSQVCGDWSAIKTQLYDTQVGPSTYTTDRTKEVPFTNNQVPISRYNSIALKILALVPQGDPTTGKITYVNRTLSNDNQYVARVDRNFGEKLRISASILRDVYPNPLVVDPKNALTSGGDVTWPSWHAAFNVTYSFGPNLLTTLGAAVSRVSWLYAGTHAFQSVQQLGANFPQWMPSGQQETGGDFYWFSWGTYDHYDIYRTQQDYTNGWTYMRGGHTLDFGAEVTLPQTVLNGDFWTAGFTRSNCAYTGYSGLDFLLGQNCLYRQYGPLYEAPRAVTPAMYINDKWRVKPGLTLNLGLRWEPWLPWADRSAEALGGIIDAAAFAAGKKSTRFPNLPPGYLVHGDPGVPDASAQNGWHMFDPRVGLAWDVRGNGKTSIRAGAGLYHDQPFARMINQMMTTNPFISANIITDPTVPWYSPYNAAPFNGVLPSLQVPPPSNTAFPLPVSFAIGFSPDFKPPATGEWNLTIERQLGQGFLLRTSYEGSESWHMYGSRDMNSAVYIPGTNADGSAKSTASNLAQRRPWYPYYGTVIVDESTSTSSFNALAISVEKRMTGSLSLLSGYRWAKCLDVATAASFSSEEYLDSRNKRLDRGRCNSDLASQLKMAVVYRLPSLQSWGFAGRNILGGWTMSGIWQWRDGFPFSVTSGKDANLDGTNNDRADLVGNPIPAGGRSRAAQVQAWFNTAAFQSAATGTPGNSPRNFLRAPGYFNLDYSLIKSFPIPYGRLKETQKIDFRAEFFNIFNHPNFNAPNTTFTSLQFGQLQSARDPRILQFALKYIF